MSHHSNSTQLADRTLWFDGDSTVPEEFLTQVLTKSGNSPTPLMGGIYVDELSSTIEQFNKFVPPSDRIGVKENVRELKTDFELPQEYININVHDYMMNRLVDECDLNSLSGDEIKIRIQRTRHELALFEERELFGVIRTLIYIINTLQTRGVVWGVGRGSSVASYLLYLIGVHDVDSVKYNLNIEDFLHPN